MKQFVPNVPAVPTRFHSFCDDGWKEAGLERLERLEPLEPIK